MGIISTGITMPSFAHSLRSSGNALIRQPAIGVRMQHVLIIHGVEAYPAWKLVFDQAADIRKHAGEISYQLLRYDNDANNIVHFSECHRWTMPGASLSPRSW